jgi:sterol 3beta-glucosyltransferase
MKIGMQTWGTDGDIRPFLALAGGLSAAGHEVSLVVTSVYNKKYHDYGKEMGFKISHIGQLKYDEETEQTLYEKIGGCRIPIKQVQLVLEYLFDPLIPEMYAAAQKLCQQNDIIVGHFLQHPAMTASEKAGKPYVTVGLNHGGIKSANTAPLGCPDLGKTLNPFWWKFSDFIVDYTFLPAINKLRTEENLPPVKNIMDSVWVSKELNLLAVSKELCNKQPDWHDKHKICGFLNVPGQAENWLMPDDLKEFIDAGPPPVFLTVGSMLDLDGSPEQITGILVQGALQAGCRAIVQSRWDEMAYFPSNPDIFKIKAAPHQFIFPSCAAVVHHGGAGTSHSATLHGCPSIVVEHFGDQPLFGHTLKGLGIAPKLLHRRNVTARKLAKEIRTVLDNPAMKKRAMEIGKSMKEEDGLNSAVKIIEKHFKATE